LQIAGTFIHVERFTFRDGAQQYERAGKRVYVAYDSETAELQTIIVGSLPLFAFDSDAELFGTETAITSAVGTDLLARSDCRVLGLYGTGRQARRHLIAMCEIRPNIETVRVFSRSADHRQMFAATMQPHVRAQLIAVDAPEDVVRGADLICCATGTNVPVLFGAWLEAGQHVTSIVASNKGVLMQGSVSRPRREFDDEVIARADRVIATLKEQAMVDEQADLFEPVQKGIINWDAIGELGELVAGKTPGRRSAHEITVFKQNSDQGVGFMALAKLAHEKAQAAGIGVEI
jgi:ornithine cyclodeaminase/alanine dehydrogenase-like protein (mu-crystallin family)